MTSYAEALQTAALRASVEHRPMYVCRSGGEFEVDHQYPAGFACVEVQPSGKTREIAGPKSQPIGIRVGAWTGD